MDGLSSTGIKLNESSMAKFSFLVEILQKSKKLPFYPTFVVTVSPNNKVTNKPFIQQISLLEETLQNASVSYYIIPEYSSRLHFHGIVYFSLEEDWELAYQFLELSLKRKIGNTLIQRVKSLEKPYKAYNHKFKCEMETTFEKIWIYIHKDIHKTIKLFCKEKYIISKMYIKKYEQKYSYEDTPMITNIKFEEEKELEGLNAELY